MFAKTEKQTWQTENSKKLMKKYYYQISATGSKVTKRHTLKNLIFRHIETKSAYFLTINFKETLKQR